MTVLFVYVTCASRNEALKIASAAVKERLAACANVFQPHTAVYKWKGKFCREKEVALVLKTIEGNYAALKKMIKQLHSYILPCILAFKVECGSKEFLKWVEESCR